MKYNPEEVAEYMTKCLEGTGILVTVDNAKTYIKDRKKLVEYLDPTNQEGPQPFFSMTFGKTAKQYGNVKMDVDFSNPFNMVLFADDDLCANDDFGVLRSVNIDDEIKFWSEGETKEKRSAMAAALRKLADEIEADDD